MPSDRPLRTEITINEHPVDLAAFHADLQEWSKYNKRYFPWRNTRNPFYILIAEMMLRRTRARQVVSVYSSFIRKYPDPESLAAADPEEVESSLYSLGLAWRVPAFQNLARILVEEHDGEVPTSYEALAELPGVGDYVASAVCCFAFKRAVIIADANTVRVVGRLFGVPTHAESRRRRPVREMLGSILDEQAPDSHNYALLDLAALICTPEAPACEWCPVLHHCSTGLVRVGEGGRRTHQG